MFPAVRHAVAQRNYHRSAQCEIDENQPRAAGAHGSLVVPPPRGPKQVPVDILRKEVGPLKHQMFIAYIRL